jgi:hypothetical protein
VLPETLDADFEGVAGEALAVGGADLLCGTLTAPPIASFLAGVEADG